MNKLHRLNRLSPLNNARLRLVVLASLTSLLPALAEQGGLGLHKRIFVLPRPGPVVIDGKLADWDRSGQIAMYVTKETSEVQGAKFAMTCGSPLATAPACFAKRAAGTGITFSKPWRQAQMRKMV